MDQNVKEQWVAALRSGKYKQAPGALHKGDAFCCLGVLCDISGLGAWETSAASVDRAVCYAVGNDARRRRPPDAVSDWAGIHGTFAGHLAALNDSGAQFNAIADLVEAQS